MTELLSAQFLSAHPCPKQFGHQIAEVTLLVKKTSLDHPVEFLRDVSANLDVVGVAPLTVPFSPSVCKFIVTGLWNGVWVGSEQ